MANDLVVQLGAKLDQFASDMNKAGDIADSAVDRIESSFASLNPGASLGSYLGVAAGGAAALLAFVVELNKNLSEMQATAKSVGLTLADFQGVQFGGQVAGLSTAQINTGLQESARLLNDASRNSNSLSKELAANNISIRQSNGSLITENQLLTIAGNLIANAKNPGDQQAIAQMLGFTQAWIPLLERGGAAMTGLAAEARAAGAAIDEETINKAAEFDAEWRRSSVTFSANMKAAMADLLPIVDDLIERAIKFAKSLTVTGIEKTANESLDALGKQAGLPSHDSDKVLSIDVNSEQTREALADFKNASVFSLDFWSAAGRALAAPFQSLTPKEAAANIPGYAASQVVEPSYPTAEQMDAAFDKANPPNPGSRAHPLPGLTAGDYDDGTTSKVAAKEQPNDALDRAENQIIKRTADYQAETAAVGQNTQVKIEAKAVADLTTAAQRAGITLTDEQKQKISELAAAEGVAAQAAADRNQQLQQQNQLLQFAGNQAISVIDGLRTGSLTAAQAVQQLANSLITAIEQATLLGSGPLAGVFGTAAAAGSGTTGGLLGALFGKKFEGGGYTGAGGVDDPAGIVHKGEVVFSQDDIRRAGGLGAVEGYRLRGYAAGGIVSAPSVSDVRGPAASSSTGFTLVNHIDARGADAATQARIVQALAKSNRDLERNVLAIVSKNKRNNPGLN